MIRRAFPDAWYGDCRLDGQVARLVNVPNVGWRVQINDDSPIVPKDDNPLYLRVTDDGPLKLCGQGAQTGWAIEYVVDTDEWLIGALATYGVNPLIFLGQDIVYSTVADGSQGFRYVATDGTVITGDATVNSATQWAQICGVIGPLWEWSHFDGLTIGQGETHTIAEWQGQRFIVSRGPSYFIRVRRHAEKVAVYIVKAGYAEALWFDVSELGSAELPLEPVVPVPPNPVQKPPVITVHFYEPVLKAGVPWAVDFSNDGDGTRFVVSKDEADRLWIEAQNAAGETQTGKVRQLTVEGPTPEPEPPPMHTASRFWCHPNIGSKDLLDLFDDPSRLVNVDVFGLYVQEILTDVSTPQLGTNIWPNLVAHDVVRKLAQAGIPLAIELGAVKPGDCHAEANIAGMQTALQRVHDAGGVVGYLTMDEPLTANQQACGGNLAACADAVAAFIHSAGAIDPTIKVGWIEAWPEVSYANQSAFLTELNSRHALPSHWHLDIDWNRAAHEHKDASAFIHQCQSLADSYGIPLGVQINSTVDPIATEAAHHQNLVALANTLKGIVPNAQRVIVQSWATRTGGTQDVPLNLGPSGLLETFSQARPLFDSTPVDPPEEEDVMLYTLVDPVVHGLIGYKLLKPVAGEPGVYTAVMPDDTVASIQPNGAFETRPAGTEGAYEKCSQSGTLLLYHPVDAARWAWAACQVIR